jgi:phage replication-related protein YjqB (UPF0714/DUF867 family)
MSRPQGFPLRSPPLYIPATERLDTLVIAIHAGYEIGTADVARRIHAACPARAGLYIHWCPNHITSAIFHEPLFDTVVRHYKTVISIHGMRSTDQIAHVGGRDRRRVLRLRKALGLPLRQEPPPHLRGLQDTNVVNRGSDDAGVQVEISYPLLFKACPLRNWIADRIAATLMTSSLCRR